MGISAVVLTRNCAKTLPANLASVRFCDEVIVIDDQSTDDTVAVAHSGGASVYSRPLHDDFAAQRNFGMSKAGHEWILFVDSDERVSVSLAAEIRDVIGRADVQGFYLRRQDMMWGKMLAYGETGSVRLLRLGRKGSGKWQRPVHETWNISGVVGTLSQPLIHTPHPDVAQFLASINRYSTMNARYLADVHTSVSLFQILAYPTAKFIRNYIFLKGFLDGMPGIIVALMMSFHSFLTRAKVWHLSHGRV